jgi:GST-like protein
LIKLLYHPSPDPAQVALFLEESGLAHEPTRVDTKKGDQHPPGDAAQSQPRQRARP